jgi:excisionase family DNA binding protein
MAGHDAGIAISFCIVKVFGDWMTVAEAARILKVSTRRVHQFIDEGRLEAEKIGRDVFIRRPSVEVLKRQPRRPGRPKKEK